MALIRAAQNAATKRLTQDGSCILVVGFHVAGGLEIGSEALHFGMPARALPFQGRSRVDPVVGFESLADHPWVGRA